MAFRMAVEGDSREVGRRTCRVDGYLGGIVLSQLRTGADAGARRGCARQGAAGRRRSDEATGEANRRGAAVRNVSGSGGTSATELD